MQPDFWHRPEPQLLPVPKSVRGFRIRLDLLHTKPPVWRRIEVPGDIVLPQLHEVIQAAMGWMDGHLHRFRTSNERNPPEFLTQFDLEQGEDGMLKFDLVVLRCRRLLVDSPHRVLWSIVAFDDLGSSASDWDGPKDPV